MHPRLRPIFQTGMRYWPSEIFSIDLIYGHNITGENWPGRAVVMPWEISRICSLIASCFEPPLHEYQVGHCRLAVMSGIVERTPNLRASLLAVVTTPRSREPPTATSLPLRCGGHPSESLGPVIVREANKHWNGRAPRNTGWERIMRTPV